MEIRILEKTDELIRFIIADADPALANALRRIILIDLPVLAIEEVVLVENSSALYDELLAHRLGLIPLITDLSTVIPRDQCTCGGIGCSSCQVEYILSKEAGQESLVVYSGDLETEDPIMKPAKNKIPIVKLAPGQKLEFEAFARLGTGKEHVKWQGASTVAYRYMPIIEVDAAKSDERDQSLVEICPKNIFTWDSNGLGLSNVMDCILCNACIEKCETKSVSVRYDEHTFIFTVETSGTHTPELIVDLALKTLMNKVKDFTNQISMLTPGSAPAHR